MIDLKKGLVEIYTGNGKGKTSSSVGLCVRARGHGFKVLFVQFLKGSKTGEIEPLEALGVKVLRDETTSKFIFQMNDAEKESYKKIQTELFVKAYEKASDFDVLVLDEIIGALSTNMVDIEKLLKFLKEKPEGTEVVMTGRANGELLNKLSPYADLISEINMVKHPFQVGIDAREGIEF